MFCCTDTTLATEGNRHEIHVHIAGSGPTTLHTHKIQHLHASHRQRYGYENGFTFFRVCAVPFFNFLSYSVVSTILQFRIHSFPFTESHQIEPRQQTNIKFHDHYTKSASATVHCIHKILWLRFLLPSSCAPCMNMQQNYQLEMHFSFAKSKLSKRKVVSTFFSFLSAASFIDAQLKHRP